MKTIKFYGVPRLVSLVESAKCYGLEPYTYLLKLLNLKSGIEN